MERPCSIREEANALVCWTFRNGYIEELHAGKHSELLENPEFSRITDAEMKRLLIEMYTRIAKALELRDSNPNEYWRKILYFHETYCSKWEK